MNCTECGNTGLVTVEKGPTGATYTVWTRCKCQPEEVRIPRKRYEALMAAANGVVALFVWQPNEDSGEVEPHLDRGTPDFLEALTRLRDALRATSIESKGEGGGEVITDEAEINKI